jgi:hypothetical protein
MAILDAGKIAPQEPGFLFDVSLGEPALEAVGANGGADLHHRPSFGGYRVTSEVTTTLLCTK